MRNPFRACAAACLALILLSCRPAPAQTAPDGWATARAAGGTVFYAPPGLKVGQVFSVAVYPVAPLGGKSLDDWLTAAIAADPLPPGDPSGPGELKDRASGALTGVRRFTAADGRAVVAVYAAASAAGRVALARIAYSDNLFSRYEAETRPLMRALGASLKQGGSPGAWAKGGGLVPGVYAGAAHNGSEGIRAQYRVSLYASGEYRVCDENDKDYRFNTGRYTYDPADGRLDIDSAFDLINNDAVNDSCFFGRFGDRPAVRSSSDHGVYHVWATLTYVGPAKRPSPAAEEQAKAAAEAEAKRYKWVTAPGKGLKPVQIAGVLHEYDLRVLSAGMSGLYTQVTDATYLLLADGTVHDGLPVAPDTLDVALSRAKEPDKWGRWRREGGKVFASWRGGTWAPLRGRTALPAAPGQRLAGHWGTGASSASLSGSSYSMWGVSFTSGGRFIKDRSGGASNGAFAQSGGAPAINSTSDDSGSTTSVVGGGVVVQAGHKGGPDADRAGTYSLSGYALTLRYDNGRTERVPFFFADAAHDELLFEGNTLGREAKS